MKVPPFSHKLLSTLETILLASNPSIKDQPVIVATSGGPDSTALLYTLVNLGKLFNLEIVAAFFDHGLANPLYENVDRVNEITNTLSVNLLTGFGNAPRLAQSKKLSLEEACRQLRYNFLVKSACNMGSNIIALGHTEDDQTETMLLNLIRGSGLNGLTGMKTLTLRHGQESEDQIWLFRPLLGIKHSETIACCKENGLSPITDQSNTNTKFIRNRIRTHIIPELKKVNPSINQAFKKLSISLELDRKFIADTSRKIFEETTSVNANSISLDKGVLRHIDPALQNRILQMAFMKFTKSHFSLSFYHLKKMKEVLEATTARSITLPRGIVFCSSDQTCILYHVATLPHEQQVLPDTTSNLPIPGTLTYGQWIFVTSIEQDFKSINNIDPSRCAVVDYDTVGSYVTIRKWNAGDRFQPLGMQHSKKVQDFFVDEKVPPSKKYSIPLLTNSCGIFWVAGYRIADWAKITSTTNKSLVIQIKT